MLPRTKRAAAEEVTAGFVAVATGLVADAVGC